MNASFHFEIRPAFRIAGVVLVLHLIAGGAALVLPPVATALVLCGLMLSAMVQVRSAMLTGNDPLVALRTDASGRWTGTRASGERDELAIASFRIVFPGLVVVSWECPGAPRQGRVFARGDQKPDELRRLRVALRLAPHPSPRMGTPVEPGAAEQQAGHRNGQ